MIDLRSDTVTLPTPAMRRAMAEAEVGDDVYGEDPTVNRLEALGAERMGKEAALFVPSGTMGNLISVLTHVRRGQEVILGDQSHIFIHEAGGASALGGAIYHPVPTKDDGTLALEDLAGAIRANDIHYAPPGVICLENTHNRRGGAVLTPEYVGRVAGFAHERGVPLHLDGARIFNAAIALGVDASRIARAADSVSCCLSKGLSAPVGSLLAGRREFIDRARLVRRGLGGTMRQAGIIAAPGVVALKAMVGRLVEDHRNARQLGERVAAVPGLRVDLETVQSNMVNVDVCDLGIDGATFARHLQALGVRGLPGLGTVVRFVTYRGITEADVVAAAEAVEKVVAAKPWAAAAV